MRLIDADALKETFENLASDDYESPLWYESTVFRVIDNAPTVETLKDITEVHCDITKEQLLNALRPQGEWCCNLKNGWHCSICHEPVKDMPTVKGKAKFAFCPNCGAKMKGGAE